MTRGSMRSVTRKRLSWIFFARIGRSMATFWLPTWLRSRSRLSSELFASSPSTSICSADPHSVSMPLSARERCLRCALAPIPSLRLRSPCPPSRFEARFICSSLHSAVGRSKSARSELEGGPSSLCARLSRRSVAHAASPCAKCGMNMSSVIESCSRLSTHSCRFGRASPSERTRHPSAPNPGSGGAPLGPGAAPSKAPSA
mmetsp:Transcript_10727/g.35194  ORF Transcript_10727/g.35194 Transcript_10727/m.35194 type:complete len:201 (+) Transcript_10727:1403-2005(+)